MEAGDEGERPNIARRPVEDEEADGGEVQGADNETRRNGGWERYCASW
jgi:hypothetical protein